MQNYRWHHIQEVEKAAQKTALITAQYRAEVQYALQYRTFFASCPYRAVMF
jgi:hypothetical protein